MLAETRQHVHIYCPTVHPPRRHAASAHADPLPAVPTPAAQLSAAQVSAAQLSAAQLSAAQVNLATAMQSSRFELSFEQAFERLELLPRMFIELDGSLVWSGQQEGRAWQIDGMLYDRAGRLQRIELTGHAPRNVWEQLLIAVGQPLDSFAVHCLQQQRLIDTAEFLRREL